MGNNDMQTDTVAESNIKNPLRINTVIIIIAAVILVLNIILYLVVGFSAAVVGIVVTVLWIVFILLDRRRISNSYSFTKVKPIGALAVVPAVIAFGIMKLAYPQFTTRLNSDFKSGYGVQKLFAEQWYGIDTSEFPDKLPDNITDYHLFSFPSLRGEGGRFSVRFNASDEIISEYEAEYKNMAVQTLKRKDIDTIHIYMDNNIEIFDDKSFWSGHEEDTVIYVLSCKEKYDGYTVVSAIINRKDGMIEIVKTGV